MTGENRNLNMLQEGMSEPPAESDLNDMAKCGARRLCPLCQSPIRLFYINLNDKFLMCENTACEFPFGHEALKIVKAGEEMSDDEGCSFKTWDKGGAPVTGTSNNIDKGLNKLLESDGHQAGTQPTNIKKKQEQEKKMMKNLNEIKELNEELKTLNGELLDKKTDEEEVHIKNAKWIKNLKNLQEMSGIKLLKPEEMVALKKKEPEIGLGELKFNIIGEGGSSGMSEIRIEIHNPPERDLPPVTPHKTKSKGTLPI